MAEQRTLNFYQADVFTAQPFGGNPVAVFPEADGLTDDELQQIAREMNLSETVFVFQPTDPAAAARLRIFTPTQEIPFAGHPVLGTFYVLAHLKRIVLNEGVTCLLQECNIGIFPIEVHCEQARVVRVVMSQPKPGVVETNWKLQVVSTGLPVLIVPVRTLTAVRSIIPDASAITAVCERFGANGIMVFTTVTVESFTSVHARMFAPKIGILEDPATGSAAGALGAYLVHHGIVEVGPTTDMLVEQGYEIDRPSRILVQVESDNDAIQGVKVGGHCVMVVEGTLRF
jgi:trans-2,3-dihydro-3-hydroxyanthranilate isomerase